MLEKQAVLNEVKMPRGGKQQLQSAIDGQDETKKL